MTTYTTVDTPIGPLTLAGVGSTLTNLAMQDQAHFPAASDSWVRDDDAFPDVAEQLDEFFSGKRTEFDIELSLSGTAFQRSVWEALLQIPYGETRSYAEIADAIGNPRACRAVGSANGRNPIAIIVPCHRVIASGGGLGGYGGRLDRKISLIELERQHFPGGQL